MERLLQDLKFAARVLSKDADDGVPVVRGERNGSAGSGERRRRPGSRRLRRLHAAGTDRPCYCAQPELSSGSVEGARRDEIDELRERPNTRAVHVRIETG